SPRRKAVASVSVFTQSLPLVGFENPLRIFLWRWALGFLISGHLTAGACPMAGCGYQGSALWPPTLSQPPQVHRISPYKKSALPSTNYFGADENEDRDKPIQCAKYLPGSDCDISYFLFRLAEGAGSGLCA